MSERAATSSKTREWVRLIWLVLILLPLLVLFFLPGGPLFAGGIWFWIALLAATAVLWLVLGRQRARERGAAEEVAGPRMVHADEQPPLIRELMNVRLAEEDNGVWIFRGRLRWPAAEVFAQLKAAFAGEAVPLLQPDERSGAAIFLMPRRPEAARERPVRPWLHLLLFALTLLTTTWAGAAHQGVDLLREPQQFAVGLPYSLALLAILGVHEMGHYFAARHHRMNVTPPYFVPVPFALGTFGAFIQMRSPADDRRALFDVAVAGPLAGLAVAIPALLYGLQSSAIIMPTAAADPLLGTSANSSLLFALLAKLALGDALQAGCVVRLSPMAFAGWLGLFITALNLLPIGQLDGGHMARAMFGSRVGAAISTVAMWSLLLLGLFVWPGLLMWALVVFFIAGRGAPPLNDLSPVAPARKWLGAFAFTVLVLILMPVPHAFVDELGVRCPYM